MSSILYHVHREPLPHPASEVCVCVGGGMLANANLNLNKLPTTSLNLKTFSLYYYIYDQIREHSAGKIFYTKKKSSNAHKIKHHKTYYLHIYMVYCVSALLSINPRSLYVVGKCSTADMHLQTSRCGFKCFLFYLDQMLNNRVVTWWQRI